MIWIWLETSRVRAVVAYVESAPIRLPGYESVDLHLACLPHTGRWIVVEPITGLSVGNPGTGQLGRETPILAEEEALQVLRGNGIPADAVLACALATEKQLGLGDRKRNSQIAETQIHNRQLH